MSYKTRINSFFVFASPATIDYLLVIVSLLVDNDSLPFASSIYWKTWTVSVCSFTPNVIVHKCLLNSCRSF